MNGYLKGNRDHFTDLVGSLLPGAAYIEPEGTYLAWLDLRGYGLESNLSDHIRSRAEVAVTEGRLCGEVGAGHIRFNFALPDHCSPRRSRVSPESSDQHGLGPLTDMSWRLHTRR